MLIPSVYNLKERLATGSVNESCAMNGHITCITSGSTACHQAPDTSYCLIGGNRRHHSAEVGIAVSLSSCLRRVGQGRKHEMLASVSVSARCPVQACMASASAGACRVSCALRRLLSPSQKKVEARTKLARCATQRWRPLILPPHRLTRLYSSLAAAASGSGCSTSSPRASASLRGGGCAIQVEIPFHSVGTGSQADAAAVSAQPQGSRPPHREAGTRGCKTELRQKNKQRERREPPQFSTPLAGSQTASSLTGGPFAGASGGRRAGSCPQS
jgi:hypothetical protein